MQIIHDYYIWGLKSLSFSLAGLFALDNLFVFILGVVLTFAICSVSEHILDYGFTQLRIKPFFKKRHSVPAIISGLFLMFSYIKFGFSGGTLFSLLLIPFFIFHYVTDVKTELLYDIATVGITFIGIAMRLYYSWSGSFQILYSGLIAMIISILLTVVPTFLDKLAPGDTLLYMGVSVLVGKFYVIPLFFLASLFAAVYIMGKLAYLSAQKKRRLSVSQYVPFAPFLCLAAAVIWIGAPSTVLPFSG